MKSNEVISDVMKIKWKKNVETNKWNDEIRLQFEGDENMKIFIIQSDGIVIIIIIMGIEHVWLLR